VNTIITFSNKTKPGRNKYDPWSRMDEVIDNYRKSEEVGPVVIYPCGEVIIRIPEPKKRKQISKAK